MTMPAFYIPHGGGPCFFMDWTPPDTWNALGDWMRSIPATLPQQPKAQLVFSAHWEQPQFTLLTTPNPGLYYDYYDFPPHTYELQWPAPAAPRLFDRVRQCMQAVGLPLAEDNTRDFDHGVFIPGLLMYPQAQIPTLQISLRRGLDPQEHLALGRALAPLRDEGVLILASGAVTHNFGWLTWGRNGQPVPQAAAFADWLGEALARDDRPALVDYRRLAPHGAGARPTEEHLLPLFAALGAANPGEKPLRLEPETTYGGLAMDAYLWQDASPAPFTPEH